MYEETNAYKILVKKPWGNRVKMVCREVDFEDVNGIDMQDLRFSWH
jgi:hypothetical protein